MLSYVKRWLAGFTLSRKQMMESQRCAPRCGHISFCDGRNLYVWGGYHTKTGGSAAGMATDELWIYHVNFDVWICQKCRGDMPGWTTGACCAVVLPYVYVIGGHQTHLGHVSSVYRMHLSTFEWERVVIDGKDISPRDKFSAWAYGNQIYCFGGYGPAPEYEELNDSGDFASDHTGNAGLCWNNQLLVLDLSTHRWSNPHCKGPFPTPLPRAAHATVLLGDKVYLFGGRHQQHRMNDLHCLDLRTLSWSGQILGFYPRPEGRSWHTLSGLDDNRFFLYGGYTQTEDVLGDAWIFTVSTQCWTQVTASTSKPRLWHTAVVTASKDIFIFGGCMKNINRQDDLDSTCYSDKVIKFQLQPSPLRLMCQQAVFRHFKQEDWKILPLTVQEWLNTKWKLCEQWRALLPSDRCAMGPHVVSGFHDCADDGGGGGDQWI